MGNVFLAQADALRLPLADASVDLVFTSPPYCDARTYGISAQRGCVAWVEWMLGVIAECRRVSRGPAFVVAAGVTRSRNYWPACEGLMWEWWRRGGDCQLYRPCVYHRVGIPGSGCDDYLRADWEYVMCFKGPGKLPWADNTAMGHPPKWAPGGEMSHRLGDGKRVNAHGVSRDGVRIGGRRGHDDHRAAEERPAHASRGATKRRATAEGDVMEQQSYAPPVLANPGNVIRCKVGGNLLGSKLAHENEAPFPEALAEFFMRSFCPPGGIMLDPFSGSGTTAAVAKRFGRRAVGLDLRLSQCELGRRRTAEVQPVLLEL